MNQFLDVAIESAKRAGEILLNHMGRVEVHEKNPRDLVTEADLASQTEIEGLIREAFPDHHFLGEENPSSFSENNRARENRFDFESEYAWIVDPLDGTTNFVHQLRSFSVSIALTRHRKPIVGVIYDPLCEECFYAVEGGGAFLDGKPIKVSACEELHQAMVVTGFSPGVTRESVEAERFLEMLSRARTIRRLGSAALNLCYLACGRVDAYWASSLNAWDIAAGMIILEEAGGFVRPIVGEFDLFQPNFIASSSVKLGSEIFATIDIVE